MSSAAEIEFTTEQNKGRQQDCVYASCTEADHKVGPVWGHGAASVKRALVMLSEDCPCGESYHSAPDGEDEED